MQQNTGTKSHLRRPPAYLSVSLKRQHVRPRDTKQSSRPQASKPLSTRQLSDGSNGSSAANVDRWFDRTSKQPPTVDLPSVEDDASSPCFISETVSVISQGMEMNQQIYPYAPFREQQFHPAAANSCADDYRSVIDDLTIENKKLKERLRKYEKLHGAHMEKDKLFEVKIHSLPAARRRDLEDTLRNFASSINGSLEEAPRSRSKPSDTQLPAPDSDTKDLASGSAGSRPGDSGYASMPNSGPTSTSTHNNGAPDIKPKPAAQATKDQNIRCFLKDIPAGVLPRHSVVMTERQKKKLVVKRLEQLFTGKVKGIIACHNQTLQQQEVSNSAARADQASNHEAPEEGLREANILQHQPDVDGLEPAGLSAHSSKDEVSPCASGMDLVSTPEQRPTRPLDLDPDREQIPRDNMNYLHHMGVSSSQITTEDLSDAEADADGWIFLNLLINMAQLHIMNVTPGFVRSAVADVSAKFQLSKDGQQIRWRGGREGTRLNSDSDNSSPTGKRLQGDESENVSCRKRQKLEGPSTSSGQFDSVPQKLQDPARNTKTSTQNNPFHYKPLFARAVSSDDNMSDGDTTSSRGSLKSEFSERTGATHHTRFDHQQSAAKRRTGDGPIAFYSGAKFCTDLSSECASIATPFHNMGIGKGGYSNHTEDALGCAPLQMPNSLQRTISGSFLRSRPFKDYFIGDPFQMSNSKPLSLVGKGNSNNEEPLLSMNLEWSSDAPPVVPLLDLNASGLGGTQPADHFVYTVRTRRTKREVVSPRKSTRPYLNKTMLTTILDLFKEMQSRNLADDITSGMAAMSAFSTQHRHISQAAPPVRTEILDVEFTRLRPSQLPEPSAYYEAMSTTDSDISSDDSSSASGLGRYRKTLADDHWPQALISTSDVHSPHAESSREASDVEGDEEEEDSDSSIDMLAQLRAANPAAVAAQEAEFEREIDNEPGSSAVTVGGRTVSSSSYESGSEESYESSE